jgi:hypothetical protein
MILEGLFSTGRTVRKVPLVEDHRLSLAVRTHPGPEEGHIIQLHFLEAPEPAGFASVVLDGKSGPRLPYGLKEHR